MTNYFANLNVTVSTADLRCMEDFIAEYTDPSVVEQALEGVADNDLDRAYRNFVIEEFLRESILRERQRYERAEIA